MTQTHRPCTLKDMTTTFDIEHESCGEILTREGELRRTGIFVYYCETCHHYDETEINND